MILLSALSPGPGDSGCGLGQHVMAFFRFKKRDASPDAHGWRARPRRAVIWRPLVACSSTSPDLTRMIRISGYVWLNCVLVAGVAAGLRLCNAPRATLPVPKQGQSDAVWPACLTFSLWLR